MKRMMNVKVFSNKRYGFLWAGLGFVLVIWIGIINYWTGPVYSALAFYLIPVIFIIWNVGDLQGD
jgi:hypothetical protein